MKVQETSCLFSYLHIPKITRSLWSNLYQLILMLLLSVFINSCTKDNFSSTVKQKEKSIAKAISINDLREALNRNNSIDLNKISAQSAMGQSIEDFIIDSTKILLTNNDRNESFYSMILHSKKGNSRKYFYNLFIIKDSIGQFKKYIIKFTPTLETIKNGYKNFKGSYEILKDVSSSSGQIKSNSTNIISNSIGCYEVAYDVPCIYGYVHGEGNGPGPWCDGNGSYKLFLDVCSGSGSVGYTTGTTNNGSNNGTGGNNVLITPTYEYDIVHCEDSNADDFIFNTYLQHQTWANSNINNFNQIVGSICGNATTQNKDAVINLINFLEIGPPYVWTYGGDDGTFFSDFSPSVEPFIQFDPLDNYESKYPRFTNIVKKLKSFVSDNPKILNALQKWSGFSKQQIIDKLIFRQGNGPLIKIKQLAGVYGHYNHKVSPGVLDIDEAVVAGLEQSYLESTKQATAFLLAVIVLHEFVHFGENTNGLKNTGQFEFGTEFEKMAFGVAITTENAARVSISFYKVH